MSLTMNILFINSIQCWGGAEVWLMDMMRELKERGHAVTLACRKDTPLARKALELDCDVEPIRFGGDLDPLVIRTLWKIIKNRAIGVVCTNTEKDLRAGGIAGTLAGVTRIIPSREVDYPLKQTFLYRLSYKYLASKIIVNSLATQRTLLRSAPYLSASKIRLVYKGINVSLFDGARRSSLRETYGLPASTPVVSFVGRLDKRKGLYELLEAWKDVHVLHPDAVLLIAGEGPMRLEIERIVNENSLASSVILCGFQDSVASLLSQSSMLVAPSWWEGFGYVLVEAMAARIPVVASNVSSIPEIVVDGESGLLVEPKNPGAIAGAVCRLLENPAIAEKMGLAGRRIVEQKFTLDRMVTEFEAVICEESGAGKQPAGV
jgi:glycosyltransferase involved in cell wall biosynthesis